MAIKTQMRMTQMSGSLVDLAYSGSQSSASTPANNSLNASDLGGVLGEFAGAIGRITGYSGTGNTGFTNNAAGTFRVTAIKPATIGGTDLGSDGAEFGDIFIADAKSLKLGDDQDVTLTHDNSTGATLTSADKMDITAGAATTIHASSGDLTVGGASQANSLVLQSVEATVDAIKINASAGAGGIDMDAGTGQITLDAGGISLDSAGVAANFTVASDGAAEDLTISVTGATDSSLLLSSTGTGVDAISIDATAGDMVIGPTLADGKKLTIGKLNAVAMEFEPHGTAASEKWSVVNTAGTAADAVKLLAVAGSILLDADNAASVIKLDSEGTAANAIDIDSAGGMDVNVEGVLDIDAGDDSVIAVTTSAKDLALTVSGGGTQSLILNSAGTTAAAIDINATAGGMDVDAAGAVAINAGAASNLSTSSGNLTLDTGAVLELGLTNATAVIISKAAASTTVKGAMVVEKTLSVDGNFFVKGSTTTVSSSNMIVKDPIAAFGVASSSVAGGSYTLGPVGDRGFAFPMATAYAGSPVFFWDNSGAVSSGVPQGTFRLAYAVTTGSTTSITKEGALGLDVGAITTTGVTDSALTDNRVVIAGASGVLEDSASLTFDGSDLQLANNVGLVLSTDDSEKIESDGTDISFSVGANGDINIPSNIGLTFGDDGEKIEGDGTDLTVSGNNINLTATEDVVIPVNVGILMAGAEKIESDGTDLNITVGAGGDINVGANIGMTFGNDGEKIEGDGSDLTITSSQLLNLTATTDVVIPVNVGLILGNGDENIESNNTDLTVTSGGDVVLATASGDVRLSTATAKVEWGAADSGQHIVGDGASGLAMASGAKITLDAATELELNSVAGDIRFQDGGTDQLAFDLDGTAGEVIIKAMVASDDTVFQNQAGQEQIRLSDTRGKVFFYDEGGEYIQSDGSDMTIAGGTDIKLTAGGFVEVPANIPLTFDGTGHADKISSDGTDMTIAVGGGDIVLDASDDIVLDADGDDIILKASSANAFAQFNRASATVGYLNFNGDGSAISAGSGGWGFRNNAGTMEFKDSGGAWQGFSASGGGSRKKDAVLIAATATAVTSKIGGFLTSTTGSMDVYLNGQMMLSGAGGTGNDYNVTAAQTVTFQFNVEPDDVVTFVVV